MNCKRILAVLLALAALLLAGCAAAGEFADEIRGVLSQSAPGDDKTQTGDDVTQAPKLDPGTAQEMTESLMESLISGQSNGELYVLNADGSVGPVTRLEGIAAMLMGRVEYSLGEVAQDGDVVTVRMDIFAPDVSAMMDAVLEGMEEYDAEMFLSGMEAVAQKEDCPMRQFEATLEMKYVDSVWVFAPDYDFSNAVTGGLYEAYYNNQQQMVDTLEGGEG